MDYRELRRNIGSFRLDDGDLGSQGYSRVLLQLFGYSGHGKSSFINSCKYVLTDGGPFVEHAKAGQSIDGGSMTMIRKSYQLTPYITIVDNRGFRAMTDFERAEVYAQLGNFYPLNQKVEWKEDFNKAMSALEESEMNQNFTDFLVPIFIYSAQYTLRREDKEDVKNFLENCARMTGVFPIIVITHKYSGDYLRVEKEFELIGGKEIISIENYTKENFQQSLERNAKILTVVDSAMRNVKTCLERPRDPRGDRIARKKFLLNYIHGAVVNAEMERQQFQNVNFTAIREGLEREREEWERGEGGGQVNVNIFRLLGQLRAMCTIL